MLEQSSIKSFDVMSIYLSCGFFQSCSLGFLRELVLAGGAPAWRGVSVPPHVDVYVEGDPGHSLYVVARGKAAIVRKNGTLVGDSQELVIGDYFGEMQVLGVSSRRLETVRAMTYCQLLECTQNTLTKLLKRTKADEDAENIGKTTSLKRMGTMKMLSLYPDERRHFESESVRIYKEYSSGGTRAQGGVMRRPTMIVKKATTGISELDPEHKLRSFEVRAERARQEALGACDDSPEAAQARERLVTKVVSSLRGDMRRGFMMPADAERGQGGGEKQTQKNFTKPKDPAARKVAGENGPVSPDGEVNLPAISCEVSDIREDDEDDEALIQDKLDPQCLPPLALQSPVQKNWILRQMRNQQRKMTGSQRQSSKRGTAPRQTHGMAVSASMASMVSTITTGTGGDETSLQQGSSHRTSAFHCHTDLGGCAEAAEVAPLSQAAEAWHPPSASSPDVRRQ